AMEALFSASAGSMDIWWFHAVAMAGGECGLAASGAMLNAEADSLAGPGGVCLWIPCVRSGINEARCLADCASRHWKREKTWFGISIPNQVFRSGVSNGV
ncbi:MAG: hypothetical protein RR679_09975, partial [Glutamicibacter sp.]|uniref:hypothetical protein n=1 Tax=Glutamicibacter sp. TaxID=1931995 RepID=UPI002FC9DB47